MSCPTRMTMRRSASVSRGRSAASCSKATSGTVGRLTLSDTCGRVPDVTRKAFEQRWSSLPDRVVRCPAIRALRRHARLTEASSRERVSNKNVEWGSCRAEAEPPSAIPRSRRYPLSPATFVASVWVENRGGSSMFSLENLNGNGYLHEAHR